MNYVSVAWHWVFPALGNSAFQTICHNMKPFFSELLYSSTLEGIILLVSNTLLIADHGCRAV
jgi:hypothetical protein